MPGDDGLDVSSQQTSGLVPGAVGPGRVIAFGTSIVAPAASAVTVLVIVMADAGFASPLVILITFAASLCCAASIGELARRVPSAGWAYTYNSRGLGPAAGFLTGWMMVFAYALFVPAGVALTSTFASDLIADAVHVSIGDWTLFPVILAAVVMAVYLGIRTSSTADLILVAGEMAVIAALAITILIKIGPAHYSAAAFSPATSPNGGLTHITDAMIYGITAFAGFEAAAALGEEARNTRRSVPASIISIVVVSGVFYLLVVCAATFAAGQHGIEGLASRPSPLGYLTSRYWSPSALWTIHLVIFLAGLGFVIAAANAAVRVLFAMGREQVMPGPLTRLSRRQTPVVALGCLAALTLLLGLPLTYADGGTRTFGYLAGRRQPARGDDLPRGEHRGHPRVPHRVPRPVPARAASAHPGRGRPGVPVPALGDPPPARLHPGQPAALHRPGLAGAGRCRRRGPPGPAARTIPRAGDDIPASRKRRRAAIRMHRTRRPAHRG